MIDVSLIAEDTGQELTFSKVNYDITGELIIRKILESNTDYKFEFIKNDNKYESDIRIFEYIVKGNDWDKKFIGYVEVEKALKWDTFDIPKYWYCLSFLGRKLFKFNGKFDVNNPVDNIDSTVYLKFNSSYTNCFCQSKAFIISNGKESYRNGKNVNLSNRNDFYWELEKSKLIFGIKECCDFIKEKFKIS